MKVVRKLINYLHNVKTTMTPVTSNYSIPVSKFGYVKIITSPKFPLDKNEMYYSDFIKTFNLTNKS